MDDDAKEILRRMLTEIEDLRAAQVVTFAALGTQQHFSQTDFSELREAAIKMNREAYDPLRKAIDELT